MSGPRITILENIHELINFGLNRCRFSFGCLLKPFLTCINKFNIIFATYDAWFESHPNSP